MPFHNRQLRVLKRLSREVTRFAALLLKAPMSEDAPDHPELEHMADAFAEINKILSAANRKKVIAYSEMGAVARQFSSMGEALTRWK